MISQRCVGSFAAASKSATTLPGVNPLRNDDAGAQNPTDCFHTWEKKMKSLLAALTTLTALLLVAAGQANAGVSISIGDPGFYGRVDIGSYPPPRLIYEQPIIVRRVTTWYPPIYLRVPPRHIQNWHSHCQEYNACGRPVYFINDDWYRDVYVPRYREYHHPREYSHRPEPDFHRPTYYEYRKHEHKPPKKIYIREEHHDDRGDGGRYR